MTNTFGLGSISSPPSETLYEWLAKRVDSFKPKRIKPVLHNCRYRFTRITLSQKRLSEPIPKLRRALAIADVCCRRFRRILTAQPQAVGFQALLHLNSGANRTTFAPEFKCKFPDLVAKYFCI